MEHHIVFLLLCILLGLEALQAAALSIQVPEVDEYVESDEDTPIAESYESDHFIIRGEV
jgi:hypothetical protein